MSHTTDRNDPDLHQENSASGQNKKYLILSEEERAKGFVRPVRTEYKHVGIKIELEGGTISPITEEEKARHGANNNFVAILTYPENHKFPSQALTQLQVDHIGEYTGGCGVTTRMSDPISETYARDPKFYGATWCMGCGKHLPVGEFVWKGTNEIVGS